MGLKELEFANDEDYRAARDIRLAILEREGRLAQPNLKMQFADDDLWPEMKRKIAEAGIPYKENPFP